MLYITWYKIRQYARQIKQTQGNSNTSDARLGKVMDGVGMASGQRIFGEGREGEGGVPYFSILIIFTLYIYSPYFITYFLSKNLFRNITKMPSKPFIGSW